MNEYKVVYDVPSDWVDYYYPTFLPEDFTQTNIISLNDTKIMLFSNSKTHEIRFSQGNISAESQIDSENGKVIEVEINGHQGVLTIIQRRTFQYLTGQIMK